MKSEAILICAMFVIGAILVVPSGALAPPTQYVAYKFTFEYDSEGWTVGGDGQWERDSGTFHYFSAYYSFHGYRDDTLLAVSYLTSPEMRFPNSDDLTINFYNYRRFFEGVDQGFLSIKKVGDPSWTCVGSWTDDTPGGNMVLEQFPVPSSWRDTWVQLRFQSDMMPGPSPIGWFIDNVYIQGSLNPSDLDTDGDGWHDDEEVSMAPFDFLRYTFEYDTERWIETEGHMMEWRRISSNAHSPSYSFMGVGMGAELVSPEIRLPLSPDGPLGIYLSYWLYFSSFDPTGDSLTVTIRVVGGPDYDVAYYDGTYPQQDVWFQDAVYLGPEFADEVIRIVLVTETGWYDRVYLDDVGMSAGTNPLSYDTDNDGLRDGREDWHWQKPLVYRSTFEFDDKRWTSVGLWERTSSRSRNPLYSYHCGRDPSQPYDSVLVSPPLKLPMSKHVYVSFYSWLDTLSPPDWGDIAVHVLGSTAAEILKSYSSSDLQETWTWEYFDISDYADEWVYFEWLFHSEPGGPSAEGWYVDDFTIQARTNPLNPDTDDDLVDDGVEESTYANVWEFDFDEGGQGWLAADLWELSTTRSHSGPNSYHAGRDPSNTYDSYLTSPPLKLPVTPYPSTSVAGPMRVSYWYFMDFIPEYDIASLRMRRANGDPMWMELENHVATGEGESGWLFHETVKLGHHYSGEWVQFQFLFHSHPGDEGTYEGFYVDDFEISVSMNPTSWNTDDDDRGDEIEYEMWNSHDDWRSPVAPNFHYAILMAGDEGWSEVGGYNNFWNDLVDWYYLLRDFGYQDPNIIALNQEGRDPDPEGEEQFVDDESTLDNLDDAFEEIGAKTTINDFFLVWTASHGDPDGGHHWFAVDQSAGQPPNGYVRDDDFAGEFGSYAYHVKFYGWRMFLASQCFTGNMLIDDLSGARTVVQTCGTEGKLCYYRDYVEDNNREHYDFLYHLYKAFVWDHYHGDVDADSNGHISFVEAFNYAADELSELPPPTSQPMYDDDGDGIGHHAPIPEGDDGDLGLDLYL